MSAGQIAGLVAAIGFALLMLFLCFLVLKLARTALLFGARLRWITA